MIKLGKYELCVLDLITDSRSGKLSASKIWLHIANGTSTYVIATQMEQDWLMLAVYNAIVGGSYVAIQFFKWRYNQSAPDFSRNHHGNADEYPDGMDGGLEPCEGKGGFGKKLRGKQKNNGKGRL